MKRSSSSENTSAKKLKKSLRVSNRITVSHDTGDVPKDIKVTKKKKEKKSKFEKSVTGKKLEKPESIKSPKINKHKEKSLKPSEDTKKKIDVKDVNTLQISKSTKIAKYKKFAEKKVKKNDGNSNVQSDEKPNWTELKKLKKELKKKRKEQQSPDLYKLSVEAKQMYEKLRRSDCSNNDRKKLCEKLHEMLKGHYNQIIFTHDMSRVIQWLMKYAETSICDAVFLELKDSWLSMFQTKYARQCIKSATEYGSDKVKHELANICYGNVIKLLSQTLSSPIFEKVYSICTDAVQKNNFKQEFYGDMYKNAKIDSIHTIKDVYKDALDMKKATLSAVKTNLMKIINKKLLGSSLVHTVLYEFLLECSHEDRSEMIVAVRNMIMQLSETKNGSMAGILCIWHGTNKDRKMIMKSLKDHLKDIFMSEYGHLMLMALIDCVDDTVLMKKILLLEMEKDLKEIVSNEYGKKVLLYLVARRDLHFFHPSEVNLFKQGDENATSKKQADVREKELIDAVIDNFLQHIISDTEFWLSNGSMQMITLAILKSNHNRNLRSCFEAIVHFLTNKDTRITEEGVEYNVIEHPGLHMVLKKLLQMDKQFIEKNQSSFAEVFVEKLNEQIINRLFDYNRGCFLLILTTENANETVVSSLLTKMKSVIVNLKNKTTPGARILLKKINK